MTVAIDDEDSACSASLLASVVGTGCCCVAVRFLVRFFFFFPLSGGTIVCPSSDITSIINQLAIFSENVKCSCVEYVSKCTKAVISCLFD